MCQSVGLTSIKRIEFATRYLITTAPHVNASGDSAGVSSDVKEALEGCLYDKMTQCIYRWDVHCVSRI